MPNTFQPQFDQPLGRLLTFLGKGYLHLLRTRLRHLDIDRNYFALVLIESKQGDITQQELALLLDSDKVSIVRVVDYLSEKGYIRRVHKTDDRRKHNLVLTDKARLALPEIKQSFIEINNAVLSGLENSQVTDLIEITTKLKNNIIQNSKVL